MYKMSYYFESNDLVSSDFCSSSGSKMILLKRSSDVVVVDDDSFRLLLSLPWRRFKHDTHFCIHALSLTPCQHYKKERKEISNSHMLVIK